MWSNDQFGLKSFPVVEHWHCNEVLQLRGVFHGRGSCVFIGSFSRLAAILFMTSPGVNDIQGRGSGWNAKPGRGYGKKKCAMKGKKQNAALSFVLLMGIVSMFSDMTHEGARSIYGAFLGMAGASAATIGFVMGLGEFFCYSLRLVTGYWADKKKSYWTMTLIGYAINMGAV